MKTKYQEQYGALRERATEVSCARRDVIWEISTAIRDRRKAGVSQFGSDGSRVKPLGEKEKALEEEESRLTIAAAIVKKNLITACKKEAAAALEEVTAKWAGKSYGPKTAEKISAEMEEKTGLACFFATEYRYVYARLYSRGRVYPGFELETDADLCFLVGNKIKPVKADEMRVGEFIEGDPEQIADEIIAAHRVMIEKAKDFSEAVNEYRETGRGVIEVVGNDPIYFFKSNRFQELSRY